MTKRAYDASSRRVRAAKEREATRRRVLEAARRLFVADGYTSTTMQDIAREAGVAIQSVYNAAKSKAELLHRVVDVEVAGDDDGPFSEQPAFLAIGEEPDPRRQIEMIADLVALVRERSAPMQRAYRQAAAVDQEVAAHFETDQRRRYSVFVAGFEMLAVEHLRFSREESADTAWAVGSAEVFDMLRDGRGWDANRYREWLRRTLTTLLLAPER